MAETPEKTTLSAAELCQHNDTIRHALTTIGTPWAMMLLVTLAEGPQRYGTLKTGVHGINDRMLSQTLAAFVADGLVLRVAAGGPRHGVTYSLTSMGAEIAQALRSFLTVVVHHAPQVAAARADAER